VRGRCVGWPGRAGSFFAITPLMGIAGMTVLAGCSPKENAPKPVPAAAGPAPASPGVAVTAGSLPMLDEKDPQALALGYVDDASRSDQVKFNNYVPGHQCSNCANFLGAEGDKTGGCKIFPEKRVTAQGWCTAWAMRG
jgi:hypothetical protein